MPPPRRRQALIFDPSENLYVSGYTEGTLFSYDNEGLQDTFIAKVRSAFIVIVSAGWDRQNHALALHSCLYTFSKHSEVVCLSKRSRASFVIRRA